MTLSGTFGDYKNKLNMPSYSGESFKFHIEFAPHLHLLYHLSNWNSSNRLAVSFHLKLPTINFQKS